MQVKKRTNQNNSSRDSNATGYSCIAERISGINRRQWFLFLANLHTKQASRKLGVLFDLSTNFEQLKLSSRYVKRRCIAKMWLTCFVYLMELKRVTMTPLCPATNASHALPTYCTYTHRAVPFGAAAHVIKLLPLTPPPLSMINGLLPGE